MIHTTEVKDIDRVSFIVNRNHKTIVHGIKDVILHTVENSDQMKSLWGALGISDGYSGVGFLKTIRNSIQIELCPLNSGGIGQIRIKFLQRILRNGLNNCLPSIIWTKVRRRNERNTPELGFIETIIDGETDLLSIFSMNWLQNRPGGYRLQQQTAISKKECFLTSIINNTSEAIFDVLTQTMKEGYCD